MAHVWCWRPPERTDPDDLALLGTEEFRRALCLPAESEVAAFVQVRAGARRALGGLLGVDPGAIGLGRHPCGGCADDSHGPPRISEPALEPPLSISLSRTAGCGVFAVSAGAAIGVDVEALRPVRDPALFDSVLTAAERGYLRGRPPGAARDRAFHRIWTRKEAVVKALGAGLIGADLTRLETRPELPGPVLVRDESAGRSTRWTVQDLRLSDAVAAALARPADLGPVPVRLHRTP
ncbi:4'-phosphopantetheinyl transferase superfamily protein [Streptacidiphilus sp. EB129]|uniref:4'-phosphopantetheinyl transferase family protein n=1 Tax=Streptacidiphilus sp. EB129 TaxID=3156262 RepID=UPI0035140389